MTQGREGNSRREKLEGDRHSLSSSRLPRHLWWGLTVPGSGWENRHSRELNSCPGLWKWGWWQSLPLPSFGPGLPVWFVGPYCVILSKSPSLPGLPVPHLSIQAGGCGGRGGSQVTPLLSSDQAGPLSHGSPLRGQAAVFCQQPRGGFTSHTKPRFVFRLRCFMRVGISAHSPDAAGSDNPDTVGRFSGNPLLQQKKVKLGKARILADAKSAHLPSKPGLLGGDAEKQLDTFCSRSPRGSGDLRRPN